jgi:pimeloyl-ACP methyl ester carboxylesterase
MKQVILLITSFFTLFAQEYDYVLVLVHGLGGTATSFAQFTESEIINGTPIDTVIKMAYSTSQNLTESTESFESSASMYLNAPHVNQNTKFIFVAHSLGGLVVRNMIRRNPSFKSRVFALYTLGTPHYGTPSLDQDRDDVIDALVPYLNRIARAEALNTVNDAFDNWFLSGLGAFDKLQSDKLVNKIVPDYDTSSDLRVNSPALNTLNDPPNRTNETYPIYSMAAGEVYPALYRFVGSQTYIENTDINFAFKNFILAIFTGINLQNEQTVLRSLSRRESRYRSQADRFWNWFFDLDDDYRRGANAVKYLPNAWTRQLKSYKTVLKTSTRWVPCQENYDDVGDGFDPKVNIFGQVTGYGTCPGFYENYAYYTTVKLPHDALVPIENARYDKSDNEKFKDYPNGYNHAQVLAKEGYYKEAGQGSEQMQVNKTWNDLKTKIFGLFEGIQ